VLRNAYADAPAFGPHNPSRNSQLDGRDTLQQYRPGDGQFDVHSDGQGSFGLE
jgi:hypothetical protein